MRNQAFKILGNLHILVAGPNPPTDAEWHTYVEAVKAEEHRGLDLTEMRTLVITDGGGPNAAQRKMVNDVLRGRTTRVATVSGSPFFRGIVTALTWFNPEMRLYSPDKVTSASCEEIHRGPVRRGLGKRSSCSASRSKKPAPEAPSRGVPQEVRPSVERRPTDHRSDGTGELIRVRGLRVRRPRACC
ncbi:MAG: hypothetical protein R3F14_04710 [Polyangiaceae bacterium]